MILIDFARKYRIHLLADTCPETGDAGFVFYRNIDSRGTGGYEEHIMMKLDNIWYSYDTD